MSAYRLSVMVTLVLAVAFLVPKTGNAQAEGYPYGPKRPPPVSAPQRYCGQKLSNALQILCDGVYNSMFKKNGQEMEMADYPLAYDESFPFMSRTRANRMLGSYPNRRFRRESRGIHEECCVNACTINELSSYCGP